MGNAFVIAILVLITALAVYSTIHRIRFGSSCCGERDPAEKKIRVADTNIHNYPYTYTLQVDGMHCANCARRVENALNRHEGRWAVADVGKLTYQLFNTSSDSDDLLWPVQRKPSEARFVCTDLGA